MKKYLIFLRGINVGGHNIIKMSELKKELLSLDLHEVKTLLISGNISFQTNETNIEDLLKKIKSQLLKRFSYKEEIYLRSHEELQKIVNINPFKDIKITDLTRLYVSFLFEPSKSTLPIPQESIKDFQIIYTTKSEVYSFLNLSNKMDTTLAMKILEKEYGKKITTRNWNTVLKLLSL